MHEAGEAQDWDALRELCAPTVEFDDRRRGLRTSGDLDTWLFEARAIAGGHVDCHAPPAVGARGT